MKEYYGKVSITGSISFTVQAENEEEAKELVFESLEGMDMIIKEGSSLGVTEIEWEPIDEARSGNVSQPYVDDFEIYEEK